MPLDAVVQPALHVHCPLAPQTPLGQLQAVEVATVDVRHLPESEIPSSQVVQPAGHAWHGGPKKPYAQTSQDVPLKHRRMGALTGRGTNANAGTLRGTGIGLDGGKG